MALDADAFAKGLGDSLRSTLLDSRVEALGDFEIAILDVPILMGILSTRLPASARLWSLERWFEAIKSWLEARGDLRVALASKAYPNWLSPAEIEAWKFARDRAGLRITGIEDATRSKLRNIMADVITLKLPRARINEVLTERLEKAFASIKKDWARVANTELQEAFNDGVSAVIEKLPKDEQLAARVPQKDACPKCIALFIDKSTGKPKIFKLSVLRAGDANPSEMPSTRLVHPNCRCVLVHVPKGFDFDESWILVKIDAPEPRG